MLGITTSAADWKLTRDQYMQAARECRKVLTEDRQYFFPAVNLGKGKVMDASMHTEQARYSGQLDHPNVKAAVGKWVARARRAHAIAMGREAITDNLIIINGENAYQGALYASASATEKAIDTLNKIQGVA